jgi:hypothetical protein
MKGRTKLRIILASILFSVFVFGLWTKPLSELRVRAAGPYDFSGRWGSTHTANWDYVTHQATITGDQNLFPWDFISFVGKRGAISLAGNPNVADTFAWSNPSAIAGVQAGDVLRVKANDNINFSHLSKIGLVIGYGTDAQRAWLSDGTILEYYLAPDHVGYRVNVLGREAVVRLSHLAVGEREAVGVIQISLDDPTNARLYFVSDLEPAVRDAYALNFFSTGDTILSYDSGAEALVAHNEWGVRVDVYLYSSAPLLSWSGSNDAFDIYLQTDELDQQVASVPTDGRSALVIQAQATQYFYIGSTLLADPSRANPTPLIDAMRLERVDALNRLPVVQAEEMPGLELVNFLSNLFNAYLINEDGGLYHSDRAFIYVADAWMPLLVTPEMLPPIWLSAFADSIDMLGEQRYTDPMRWRYAEKYDLGTRPPLPSWYVDGIPGYVVFQPDGSVDQKGQWSDLYETAQYISGIYHYFQVTGDAAFVDSQQTVVLDVLDLLKRFDDAYDAEFGEDGDQYPNIPMPMGTLGRIAGTYPSETATAIYAYRDAEQLLRHWGMNTEADDLLTNHIVPMTAGFDSYFWDPGLEFYTGVADQRSMSRVPGTWYQDKWTQSMLPPLLGDLGDARLGEMVQTFIDSGFYDVGSNVHWMSPDSENWCYPGCWGTSTEWTNGFRMEGGFYDGIPGVVVPIGYYQLGVSALGNQYANDYVDVWLTQGPYESMYEWNHRMPGRFIETSIYIEPTASTMWLLREALGLVVDGTEVTIIPVLAGAFSVENFHVTSQGMTAVFDYSRDANGQEEIVLRSNEGLTISAPNATPTAVTLSFFTATGREDTVLIEWETTSEIDTLGFNLWRSENRDGDCVLLNPTLIAAEPGSIWGRHYSYADGAVVPGVTYYYTLEEVGAGSTFYGPVAASLVRSYSIYLPIVLRDVSTGTR